MPKADPTRCLIPIDDTRAICSVLLSFSPGPLELALWLISCLFAFSIIQQHFKLEGILQFASVLFPASMYILLITSNKYNYCVILTSDRGKKREGKLRFHTVKIFQGLED